MTVKIPNTDEPDVLKHEKKEIEVLEEQGLQPGDAWYLVERHWYEQYKKFADNPAASNNPGPIDNTPLLKSVDGEFVLAEHLEEKANFIFLPVEAWSKLKARFGLRDSNCEIKRYVIETGSLLKVPKIEVYPLVVTASLLSKTKESASATFITSRVTKLAAVRQLIADKISLPNVDTRFYLEHADDTVEKLDFDADLTLEDINFHTGRRFLIDTKNVDGSWNMDESHNKPTSNKVNVASKGRMSADISALSTTGAGNISSSASSSHLSKGGGLFGMSANYGTTPSTNLVSSASSENFNKKSPPLGLCGLTNLGNTCFMNSALQCMSNTPPLCEYFVKGTYETEINEGNPLGMRGEMARAFGDLLKQMWNKNQPVTPKNFKQVVGRFAPQFSGYQQQDSQELLAFLLDGLHEDLNRVHKKPYIEAKDYDGMCDAAAAEESWHNYKLRNDSIIVDLFHSQLKSTLVCPVCSKRSVTFDPFCYLSLPLSVKQDRQMCVTFVPYNVQEKILQYQVTVAKNGIVQDLVEGLARVSNRNSSHIVLAQIYNNKFSKFYTSDEDLSSILDMDHLVAYETPPVSSTDDRYITICIYNRIVKIGSLVDLPLMLWLKRDEFNYANLKSALETVMSRFVQFDEPMDDAQNENENDSGLDDNGDFNLDDSPNDAVLQPMDTSTTTTPEGTASQNRPATTKKAVDTSSAAVEHAARLGDEKFRIILTNCNGNSDIQSLNRNNSSTTQPGLPLPGDSKLYICLEWKPSFEKFFLDDRQFEKHTSVCGSRFLKRDIQLSECLELFTTTERLGKHDLWYCPQCKKHQQATKKFDLWSLPEILIIHLKRFSYDSYYRRKIETLVVFPLEKLNISQWVMNESVHDTYYDLIAVSNHYGGLGGGHYTAYAKNRHDEQWYLFDDSRVSKAGDSEIVSNAAYVLVYARRHDGNPPKVSDPNFDIEDCESD